MGKQGQRNFLIVPIGFVNDPIETLHEIDVEFQELAERSGIERFERATVLNNTPIFIDALATIVSDHFRRGETCSHQYRLRCPGCKNSLCRTIVNPFQ